MSATPRVCVAVVAMILASTAATPTSFAGSVTIKVELPPAPPMPALTKKGFLERVENPVAPVRGQLVAPHIIVALEPAEPRTDATGQVSWDLVGESFAKPVVGVPAGSELVIKNASKTARYLSAVEDGKLIPAGPLNPGGPKSFRVTEAKTYTIVDKDAQHLKGIIVVVATPHVASLDANNKVEFDTVPEGAYKVRVFYRDAWVAEKPLNVPAKGKADITIESALMAPAKK